MMKKILNKLKLNDNCSICNKIYPKRKLIEFANKHYCSEECMSNHFKGLSTLELLNANKIDKLKKYKNKDRY